MQCAGRILHIIWHCTDKYSKPSCCITLTMYCNNKKKKRQDIWNVESCRFLLWDSLFSHLGTIVSLSFIIAEKEVPILKWQTGVECFASLKAICLTILTLISWWIWFYNNHYRHHQVMSHHIFPRHIIKKWFMHSVGAWLIHRPFNMKTSVSIEKNPSLNNI